ncbi:Pentulose kinase [Ascobolus immersus RN42]|uniref:Pentulose kinase n=1 Tax=Ascobolus immersus RN42 TaxID=1160509 RepID=A0A3N4HUR1_ASCIM|nr:Pentulose kinase [Ascobolus immersus RN42]
MSDSHYIGIDVGTGSARAALISSTGEILALATKDIKTWNDKPDHYEQSTKDIWESIAYCTKQILKESGVAKESVKGVGFDATCSLSVLDAETDEPISVVEGFAEPERNVILWMDHRPVEETKKINATNHPLLKYVGGQMSIEMEMPKILWLKNNMPADLFNRAKFYDLGDVLTHLATGAETRSFCSTVCKQGYVPVGIDGSVKGWNEEFLSSIGLGELAQNEFARIGGVDNVSGKYLSAGQPVGELSVKAAEELGLAPGTKVGSGVIDAYAGWIGTVGAKVPGETQEGMGEAYTRLSLVAGTSTCHLVMTPEAVFVPGVWGPYKDVLLPNQWLAEGGQSATGSLLHHVVTTHPSYTATLASAKSENKSIFDYLNAHLTTLATKHPSNSISYLARHFFFQGDLHGNRSPIADPQMRGSVVGLSFDTGVDNLALHYYGAMEFVALQTRQIIDTMNRAGHRIDKIFMSGGQCRNSVLMKLLANVCDMPVYIPKYIDAAVVLGAAFLGVVAAGDGKEGLWEVMRRCTGECTVVDVERKEGEKRLLDAKYKVFLHMTEAQRQYRKEVDEALGEGEWWKEEK